MLLGLHSQYITPLSEVAVGVYDMQCGAHVGAVVEIAAFSLELCITSLGMNLRRLPPSSNHNWRYIML
jgi:hypothetical protein